MVLNEQATHDADGVKDMKMELVADRSYLDTWPGLQCCGNLTCDLVRDGSPYDVVW